MVPTLAAIERALRAGWARDTCDEVDLADWTPQNPARGQCGVTTLVLHDLLGGRIAVADVLDGARRQGCHYWLRTFGGVDIDLTLEQFAPTEVVGAPTLVDRPTRRPRRCGTQYEILHRRVYAALGLASVLDRDLP